MKTKLLLDKNDFSSVLNIIDALTQRGFLKGDELYDMGVLYRRFKAQLEHMVSEEEEAQKEKEKNDIEQMSKEIHRDSEEQS